MREGDDFYRTMEDQRQYELSASEGWICTSTGNGSGQGAGSASHRLAAVNSPYDWGSGGRRVLLPSGFDGVR